MIKALRAEGNLNHIVFDHGYFCSSASVTRHDEKTHVVGVWNRPWMVGGRTLGAASSSSRHPDVWLAGPVTFVRNTHFLDMLL